MSEIKTSIQINGELQKRMMRSLHGVSIFYIVLGAVLLCLMSVYFIFPAQSETELFWQIWFPIMGVFFIVLGVLWLVQIKKNIKIAEKLNIEQHYLFAEQYVEVTSLRNGELTGNSKSYYTDFIKVKENKEFILLYLNAASVYPVDKSQLSDEGIAELRRILPLKKKR